MNTKQDIYEHLAEIYLDASYKTKKKENVHRWRIKHFIIAGLAILAVPTLYLFASISTPALPQSALILTPQVVKIAKLSINLDNQDLSNYKALAFSLRKDVANDNPIALRVKLTSALKSKSEIYLQPVTYRWNDYTISLSDFANISNWTNMLNLSFAVENPKTGKSKVKNTEGNTVYLNNVRFLR